MSTDLHIAINCFILRFRYIKLPNDSSVLILHVEQMIDNNCEFWGSLLRFHRQIRLQNELIGKTIASETMEQLELLEVALTWLRNKRPIFAANLIILNIVAAGPLGSRKAVPQTRSSSNLLSLGDVADLILIVPFDILFRYR